MTDCTCMIETFTGRMIDPLNPTRAQIRMRDIAHALSQQCRFTGHTRVFYSVAEHSVRVAGLLRDERREVQAWGLLHDAAEAYIADVAFPVKSRLHGYAEIEERLLQVISGSFGLVGPVPHEVWEADKVMLATEARDLMPHLEPPWDLSKLPEPVGYQLTPWSPKEAERFFLRLADRLIYEMP